MPISTSPQVIFSVEANPRTDNIVRWLNEWGIGDRAGSFVTILPCTLYKNAAENQSEADEKRARWVPSSRLSDPMRSDPPKRISLFLGRRDGAEEASVGNRKS